MCTSDPNQTALSLFTAIVYLAIQVACFNAMLDCIANMIGRLLDLHIVESTPCNQAGKRRGFLIFDLTFRSHFTFSSCCVKSSVKTAFWYLTTFYKYSIRNFQKRFHQTVIKHAKIMFPSVAFVYSLSIFLYCLGHEMFC